MYFPHSFEYFSFFILWKIHLIFGYIYESDNNIKKATPIVGVAFLLLLGG